MSSVVEIKSSICVRIKQDRNFRKSQWFSFSTVETASFQSHSHGKESARHTLRNSPKVFSSLDNTTVGGSDVFGGSDDGERHGVEKHSSVFSSGFVISIDRGLVNADALSGDYLANLHKVCIRSMRTLWGRTSHSLFERVKVVLGQCIRLRDYGDEVDARPETLHDFYVQRLEPGVVVSAVGERKHGKGRTCGRWDG